MMTQYNRFKIMARTVSAMLLAAALVMTGGCGEDKPAPAPDPKSEASQQQVEVRDSPGSGTANMLSKPRSVKSSVTRTLDKEAEDRAKKVDEFFK